MDEGDGGDKMDQFHRNEAISAVADDGFLGEEDDDYEDLYNDVNVGEGFLQSLRKNEDLGFRNAETDEKFESQRVGQELSVSIPGVGGSDGMRGGLGGSKVSGRVEGYQNQGEFRGNELDVSAGGSGVPVGGGGLRVELGQASRGVNERDERSENNNVNSNAGVQGIGQQVQGSGVRNAGNESLVRQGAGIAGNMNAAGVNGVGIGNTTASSGAGAIGGSAVGGGSGSGGNGTILFVGDLHWWTTDADLEVELIKYGSVKEVKFFDEKASGKSKGYCQVEFYDPAAATACKEGMNGHLFNGRPCVVAFATPYTVKKMGEAQANRNQQMGQGGVGQARRGANDIGGKPAGSHIQTGGNYQGGDNNRGYGRGNWGRGNAQGMGNRGPVGPMRNRAGGMGGRGLMGNGGNGFGQGIGATPPMMHPMGQGFDPAFGGPMGRMGNYVGFPGAPAPPFSGMMPSFPPVGGVGLPGVAPHVNPAFFGRGMPMNGMAMMPTSGVDGPNMGMWSDPSMGGWGGEEPGGGGRAGESSYGEEAASDHQYGEVSHDRGGWPNAMKEKDRGSERDWSGSSDRRFRDDREAGYDRNVREKDMGHDRDRSERRYRDDRDLGRERGREHDRDRERSRDHDHDRDRERDHSQYREDRDRYGDHHRYREREVDHDGDWDKGRSSKTHSKSRISQEDDRRSRSRDADYGKRRRVRE